MRQKTDYLLIGTGVAPLLAAQRLIARGDSVVILNPDSDFFLENSELPLDPFSFESADTDLTKRFSNNLPEQVYKDLLPEFPGALEMWKEEQEGSVNSGFQVESAPWIRSRYRLWVAADKSKRRMHLENLYLRSLDLGWKPKWLEGVALAKRFPGFSSRNLESRGLESWSGFLGPRFGDVDVSRYRTGILEYLREKLGRENIVNSAHILDIDQKGVRFQRSEGLPTTIEVSRAVLYFWTPKLERKIEQNLEKYAPRMIAEFQSAVARQLWEEWDLLSRDPVNPYVVAHLGSTRIWSYGEGAPPVGGWNRIKVMRKETSDSLLGEQSFQELSKMIFDFMGWDRFTVRNMSPRIFYRWNQTSPLEYDSDGVRTLVVKACDGPIHWIANQVRKTIDGV